MTFEAFREAVRGSEDSAGEDSFAEGRVQRVSAEGMFFTVPDWDDGKHVFGPAPWPMSRVEPIAVGTDPVHDHEQTIPEKGARVLVLFLGSGIDRPWVVMWWPT